jgi:hypothetical protein
VAVCSTALSCQGFGISVVGYSRTVDVCVFMYTVYNTRLNLSGFS